MARSPKRLDIDPRTGKRETLAAFNKRTGKWYWVYKYSKNRKKIKNGSRIQNNNISRIHRKLLNQSLPTKRQ